MADIVSRVRQALSTVQDPDLHKDLVTLNMIRDLQVTGDVARFKLVLTTGACPVKEQLEDDCRQAALGVDGITDAVIEVTSEVPQGFGGNNQLPGVGHVIAVASGKGGVGKSTVTINLAAALMQSGARVGILDADIYGPSMPMMAGVFQKPTIEDKKIIPIERHGMRIMSVGFLIEQDEAVVWRGPMLQGAVRQFITDVDWGELDYLLIDLPPGTGDVQITLAQNVRLSGAVVVTTPQNIALMDAKRGVGMFQKTNVRVFGIIENMSLFICPACGHAEPIFDQGGGERYADELQLPFLGAIPLDPSVRIGGDAGTPVVISHPESAVSQAFQQAAAEVARHASILAHQTRTAETI